jgi:hypothetical protein
MMADDFFDGVGTVTPDAWLKSIDERKSWRALQKSFAGGTVINKSDGALTRLTIDNVFSFQFRNDHRWYFAGVVGD